jgi:hypothetical protein
MSLMKHMPGDTALVTVGQVAAKQALREKKMAERESLNADIERLDAWLAAAAVVAGGDVLNQTAAEVDHDEQMDSMIEEENMADATQRILGGFVKGIAHPQLQSELRKIPRFAERLDKNPNYYYTMVSRLIKRGAIVKYRKALRLPPKPEIETAGT